MEIESTYFLKFWKLISNQMLVGNSINFVRLVEAEQNLHAWPQLAMPSKTFFLVYYLPRKPSSLDRKESLLRGIKFQIFLLLDLCRPSNDQIARRVHAERSCSLQLLKVILDWLFLIYFFVDYYCEEKYWGSARKPSNTILLYWNCLLFCLHIII